MAYPSVVQHQKLHLFPNFHDFLKKPHGCPSPSSKALHYDDFPEAQYDFPEVQSGLPATQSDPYEAPNDINDFLK